MQYFDKHGIEIKAGISFDCIAFARHLEPFLTGCTVVPADSGIKDSLPAVSAYTVLPSDSLWDIAKRFSTSEASICETNEITEDTLTPGELLLIVRECDSI